MEKLLALKVTATGEVRDKDGNLVEQIPVEHTIEVTPEQAAHLLGIEIPEEGTP